jgi:hypothetical protein
VGTQGEREEGSGTRKAEGGVKVEEEQGRGERERVENE